MDYDLAHGFEILERTPATLAALLTGLSDPWVLVNEGGESFSPRDVIGHLIGGEETDWVERTKIILDHGVDTPFPPFDRFSFREDYKEHSLAEMLETFRDLRSRNLECVRAFGIGPEQLDLEGAHPELGTVTLRQLLATWTVHDLAHIRQITRVMAKQYNDAVGPWRKYLRVLDE